MCPCRGRFFLACLTTLVYQCVRTALLHGARPRGCEGQVNLACLSIHRRAAAGFRHVIAVELMACRFEKLRTNIPGIMHVSTSHVAVLQACYGLSSEQDVQGCIRWCIGLSFMTRS